MTETAHHSDVMDPAVYKVLRRVCLRHSTSVKKPFLFEGKEYIIMFALRDLGQDEWSRYQCPYLCIVNGTTSTKYMWLASITPEELLNAIRLLEIECVISS